MTDNAANMLAAVPKHTKKVDMGLPCFDHLLNLVVKAANINDEDVQEAIKVKFEKSIQNFRNNQIFHTNTSSFRSIRFQHNNFCNLRSSGIQSFVCKSPPIFTRSPED